MINLTELIIDQIRQIGVMVACGMLVAISYQLLQNLFKWLDISSFWRILPELVYWAGAALITGEFIYYCAYGQLGPHILCAFIIGVVLWKSVMCDKIKHV